MVFDHGILLLVAGEIDLVEAKVKELFPGALLHPLIGIFSPLVKYEEIKIVDCERKSILSIRCLSPGKQPKGQNRKTKCLNPSGAPPVHHHVPGNFDAFGQPWRVQIGTMPATSLSIPAHDGHGTYQRAIIFVDQTAPFGQLNTNLQAAICMLSSVGSGFGSMASSMPWARPPQALFNPCAPPAKSTMPH